MVNSDKAGVIFTINPITNSQDDIVVEAAFGLGEGVVSGAIAPDHYVVDKENLKPKKVKVSYKNFYFTRSSAGETIKKQLSPEKAKERVLELRDLMRLASYAKQLEKHYKIPQDIEWAIEYGKIYILQTRPVTTHENKIQVEDEVKGSLTLEGLAASPGVAMGKARIIHSLEELSKVKHGDILITKMTNPDMVITMQKAKAIVTDEGGTTAHAAIVSREMGIPCVVGTEKATLMFKDGEEITVDGTNGKIYRGKAETSLLQFEPPKKKEVVEENLLEEWERWERNQGYETEKERLKPKAETKTKVYMNLSQPDQIEKHKDVPFEGIGLLRLEFLIASKIKKHPLYMIEHNDEENYIKAITQGVEKVAATISPKPIIVRFSDFKSNEYKNLEGGEKYEPHESNPMLGFRGVSRYISPKFEKAFRLECKGYKTS